MPSRADEIAYINELRKAYAVEPNGPVPCYTGAKLKPFRPKYVQGYPDMDDAQDAGAFDGQCLRFAENPGPDKIGAYLENGFGLTDLYCQRYFIVATQTRQGRRLQRGLFKTGDTLMNAVLSALSVGANPIAISSAGFSAVDAGYGAIDDAFVVAPSRDDVRQLVLSAQQRFRADIFTKDTNGVSQVPKSYASARATVERYAGLCTFDGMRQLVADALAAKTAALNASAEAPKTPPKAGETPAPPAVTSSDTAAVPPPISPK